MNKPVNMSEALDLIQVLTANVADGQKLSIEHVSQLAVLQSRIRTLEAVNKALESDYRQLMAIAQKSEYNSNMLIATIRCALNKKTIQAARKCFASTLKEGV